MRKAFLLLFLFPLAAAAADPAVPEAKKDDPASPTNRVDQWKATKGNDDLYKGEIKEASFGAEMAVEGALAPTMAVKEAVSQKDSLLLQSNTLTSCLDNSLNGRADELCKESPGHPECMGFNVALENSICRTPGYKPKDDTECKQPNLNDYTAEEWFAFGQQYYAGMQHCGTIKVKAADTNTMRSLNDAASDGKVSSTGTAATVASGVSGSVPAQSPTASSGGSGASVMPATAVKENGPGILNDGSRHLGYEPGSLLKKAESGESFYSVVMHSPTFEELKESDRASVEKGLLEPDLVLDKARMAGRLPRLGENLAQYAAATAEAAEKPAEEEDSEERAEKLEALAEAPAPDRPAVREEPKPAKPVAPAVAAAPAPSAPPSAAPEMLTPVADLMPAPAPAAEEKRPLLLAERIARLEAAAQAARRAKEAGGRGPASLPSLKEEKKPRPAEKAAEALNLFQRVNRTYQRKGTLLSPAVKASPNFSSVSEKPKLIPDL